jgi:NAD(P)-dependent dehydrogenase (short-subunit alcohol dehydrogenase family)
VFTSADDIVDHRRAAHPTEVAAAIAFFGSPEAFYVTGRHIGVSGGMAML